MKVVIVRKVAKYDPVVVGMSKYESYDLITRRKCSVGIVGGQMIKEKFKFDLIVSSDLKRAKETAKLYSKQGGSSLLQELREVKFSLKDLVTEDEYEKNGSIAVRRKFVEKFVEDKLLESREDIKRRLVRFSNILRERGEKKILVISHSFLMKMMEAYFKFGYDVFKYPETLAMFIKPNRKTYDFMKGFELYL